MSERNFLIVATYNHEAYRDLERAEVNDARNTAEKLFGRRAKDQAGKVTEKPPNKPLTNFFTFVAAFPYFEIPESDTEDEKEKKRATHLYGWVAIVSEYVNLEALKKELGWPDSPFCQVFNIQISEINSIEGKPVEVEQDLQQKIRDAGSWKRKGVNIYHEQTPAMWEG